MMNPYLTHLRYNLSQLIFDEPFKGIILGLNSVDMDCFLDPSVIIEIVN